MSCKQIDGAVLTAREVLDQAHDQAVFGVGLDDEGRNLALAERLIRFQPALAAHEVVSRPVGIIPTRDGDWPFSGPSSAMFATISLNIFLLRTRGLITVMRSMGISSIVSETDVVHHATSRS